METPEMTRPLSLGHLDLNAQAFRGVEPAIGLRQQVRGAPDRYDMTVSWPAGEGVDRYEIVWRDTMAPDWQFAGMFGKGAAELGSWRGMLTATLEGVCIDDVVVGVRSVGADGARSRVVTPSEPDAMATRGR